jgi:hypothetical protein
MSMIDVLFNRYAVGAYIIIMSLLIYSELKRPWGLIFLAVALGAVLVAVTTISDRITMYIVIYGGYGFLLMVSEWLKTGPLTRRPEGRKGATRQPALMKGAYAGVAVAPGLGAVVAVVKLMWFHESALGVGSAAMLGAGLGMVVLALCFVFTLAVIQLASKRNASPSHLRWLNLAANVAWPATIPIASTITVILVCFTI